MKNFLIFILISFVFSLEIENDQNFTVKEASDPSLIINLEKLEFYLNSTNSHVLLFLGNENTKIFQKLNGLSVKNMSWIWSNSSEIFEKFSVDEHSNEVILFEYDNTFQTYKNGIKLNISDFYKNIYQSVKSKVSMLLNNEVVKMNEKIIKNHMQKKYPTFILILKDDNELEIEKTKNLLNSLKNNFRGNLKFMYAIYTDEESRNFFKEQLNYKIKIFPHVIILDTLNTDYMFLMKKYSLDSDINPETINSFISEFVNNKLEPLVKSEKPSSTQNKNLVQKIVALNFNEFFEENKANHILFLFSAEDCASCKILKERLNRIKPLLTNLDPNFKLAEMDIRKNDIETVYFEKIPSLVYFPPCKYRFSSRQKFKGNFTTIQIIDFINNQTKFQISNESFINDNEQNLIREKVFQYEFDDENFENEIVVIEPEEIEEYDDATIDRLNNHTDNIENNQNQDSLTDILGALTEQLKKNSTNNQENQENSNIPSKDGEL